MDECKPLAAGIRNGLALAAKMTSCAHTLNFGGGAGLDGGNAGRGLHSSTLQLNLSAFCVTGGAVRGYLRGV